MAISVIIPHYGKPDQLARCLAHLAAQTPPCLPIVEDNNVVNRGYTRAVNDGLRKVGAEHRYAIVLNQDAYLAPDAVSRMVEFMDLHPRCAIGGVKQVYASDPDLIYHGGGADVLPAGSHHTGRISNGDCAESRRVGWVNGACQIVRMSALAGIGLMDEAMFLCGSDADWCVAAVLRGWECWYIADALCVHEVGVSAKPDDATAAIIAKDMDYLLNKLKRITLHGLVAVCPSCVPDLPGGVDLLRRQVGSLYIRADHLFGEHAWPHLAPAQAGKSRAPKFSPHNELSL